LVTETRSIGSVLVHKYADSHDVGRVHVGLQRRRLAFPFNLSSPTAFIAADN
jgi:hypothetical protein